MKRIRNFILFFIMFALVIPTIPAKNVQAAKTIKLNKSKVTMYVGDTITLKLTGTSKKVKWTSKKKTIASVSSKGKVKANKKGTVTIIAKISKKTYKCKVVVKDSTAKGIAINKKKELKVTKGKSYTLRLSGTTAKKWSSSDNEIATINKKGKLTPMKCGVTIIKVKASNKKTYKCKVMVRPQSMTRGATHLYVAVNDTSFDYKTDFRNLIYDEEYYKISFAGFESTLYKGGKAIRTLSTEFDITKPGVYLAKYKFTPVTGEESSYMTRMITVTDDVDYVNGLDQK